MKYLCIVSIVLISCNSGPEKVASGEITDSIILRDTIRKVHNIYIDPKYPASWLESREEQETIESPYKYEPMTLYFDKNKRLVKVKQRIVRFYRSFLADTVKGSYYRYDSTSVDDRYFDVPVLK